MKYYSILFVLVLKFVFIHFESMMMSSYFFPCL